jgi:hypothetical protein
MKLLATLCGVSLITWGGVAYSTASPKVTICHATEKPSYIRIVVSENAIGGHFDNPGTPKAGHENDILLQGEQYCPSPEPETDPNPEPSPVPTPVPQPKPLPTPTTPAAVPIKAWGK